MTERVRPPVGPSWRGPAFAAALAAALTLGGLWVAQPWRRPLARGPGVRPNLLLVTIDTLRADRASPALMPNLAALGSGGTTFTRARTVAPLTLPAHASLLTGLLPPRTGVRLNGVHRLATGTPTLATLLHAAGYRSAAFVGAFVLDRQFGLAAGFDAYDGEIARKGADAGSLEAQRPADVVADRAIAWMQAQPSDGRPFFAWVHFYDPHAPYAPPAEWLQRAGGRAYEGEVAFADAQLGRILAALRAAGLADRTLAVVAGDHGESLGDHGEATHGLLLYEPALRIPLVMSGPGIPMGRREEAVSLVDVMPSVLDRLGVGAPAGLDGRSLFASGLPAGKGDSYAETLYPELAGCSGLRMTFDGRWKFIGGPAESELYDLERDPAERENLASSRRSMATALAARAAAIAASARPAKAVAPNAEAVERLRALGYLASGPGAPAGAAAGPSPLTIVREWGRLESAMEDVAAGRRDHALATLAALARARPDASAFQSTYARVLLESGQATAALEVYRRTLERWPADAALWHGRAAAARDAGRIAEATSAEQAALTIDPAHAPALNGLGLLHAEAGRIAEARAAFERALAVDPHVVSYWSNLGNARMADDDLAGAEAAYREALRLDPASDDGANGLGTVLVKTRRTAEALPLFERVVAASPTHYDAWLNLGIARQELGDDAAAAAAYRHALAAPARFAAQRSAARKLLASLGQAP